MHRQNGIKNSSGENENGKEKITVDASNNSNKNCCFNCFALGTHFRMLCCPGASKKHFATFCSRFSSTHISSVRYWHVILLSTSVSHNLHQ